MKIVWRTLIILAVAMVVVVGAIAFSHSNLATQLDMDGGREGRFPDGAASEGFPDGEVDRSQFDQFAAEGGFPERGDHGGEGRFEGGNGRSANQGGAAGSFFNLTGLLKNLGIISAIFLAVALIDTLFGRIRKRKIA